MQPDDLFQVSMLLLGSNQFLNLNNRWSSLSHCLGIGNFAPKVTTELKSRGASFAVQRFGATSRDAVLILLFLHKK